MPTPAKAAASESPQKIAAINAIRVSSCPVGGFMVHSQ